MSSHLQPVVYDSVNARLFGKNPISGLASVPSNEPALDAGTLGVALLTSENEGGLMEFSRSDRTLLWVFPEALNGGLFGLPRAGTRINIIQLGTGPVEIWNSIEDPVTIYSPSGKRTLAGQYSQASLYCRGNDIWYIDGDLINDTKTYSVTNTGATSYNFTGEGLSGAANPAISLGRYQELELNINAPGHPFWIKTTATGGTGDPIPSGALEASANGVESGTIRIRFTLPGTYYYLCQFHPAAMVGTITVS
jgi:hypothetical protein